MVRQHGRNASGNVRRQKHLAEVDELLATVVVLVVQPVVRRLQPPIPESRARRHRRVGAVRVDRRKVAAARDVVLGGLQRAGPEVLEVLDAVLAVRLGVVQLHRRQVTRVAVVYAHIIQADPCTA